MLNAQETLYSLNHWRTTFRTYYRRDSFFKAFLLPNATWDASRANYGQTNDTSAGAITRTSQDKAEDLKGIVSCFENF